MPLLENLHYSHAHSSFGALGTLQVPFALSLTHWLAFQPTCALLQVFEWLTWAASELALVSDEKLQHINSHLATRMFLTGNILSLADLVVFGILHPAVVSSVSCQALHRKLSRWVAHAVSKPGWLLYVSFANCLLCTVTVALSMYNPGAAWAPPGYEVLGCCTWSPWRPFRSPLVLASVHVRIRFHSALHVLSSLSTAPSCCLRLRSAAPFAHVVAAVQAASSAV